MGKYLNMQWIILKVINYVDEEATKKKLIFSQIKPPKHCSNERYLLDRKLYNDKIYVIGRTTL